MAQNVPFSFLIYYSALFSPSSHPLEYMKSDASLNLPFLRVLAATMRPVLIVCHLRVTKRPD